jgi:drug/metabolite transporter (DMT)-like permease
MAIELTRVHIYTLLYLGILASGICFFLWNYGAVKVNSGLLAVMNNLKVPLGMLFSIAIFGEEGNLISLLVGGSLIIAAGYIAYYSENKNRVYAKNNMRQERIMNGDFN